MNARLSAGLVGVVLLGLATAPVASAAPAAPAGPPASTAAAPASAYGYTFEREWVYTSNVTNDVLDVAASPKDEVFAVGQDDKIRRFDLKGNLTKTWTLPEGTSAMALGVDPRNGQLHIGAWGHIADGVPSGVLVYTRDGAYVRSYVAPVDFTWTGGIAIDSNGTSYVANARDNMIHSFSASGEHLGSFGGTGTDDGQFGQPGDVALGKDGTLYVPDIDNDRIQQFTTSGTFVRAWGQGGLEDGRFMGPTTVAVAPGGNVFVTDKHSRRVQEFTSTGTFVRSFGEDYLRKNVGVSFDRHGALYVAGYLESLVQGIARFAPAKPTGKKTKVTAKATKQTYGKRSKVAITVSKRATGTVTVKAGKKTVTGKLKAGKATVRLPKRALKPGRRTITVSYAGVPGKFRPSSTTAKVRVVKAKPTIKVKALTKRVKAGKKASFRITVKASGTTPRGKVTVKASGAKAKTVKLSSKGRAKVTLKFAKKAKAGKRSLTVTYRGTKLVKKTTVTKGAITVRR